MRAIIYLLVVSMLLNLPFEGQSQAYIGFSKYAGGNAIEEVTEIQVINGETYLLCSTRSANFPVTNSSVFRGEIDITLTKFDNAGNVLFATYLGGRGNETATAMKIVNGEIYIAAYTDSINYPVTNASVFTGRRDAVVTKLDASGNILFSTYIGGNGSDYPAFGALHIEGNRVIIAGTTGSPNFPVTGNSSYGGGTSDGFATVLNASDGSILASRFVGGSNMEIMSSAVFDNSSVYPLIATLSDNIPTTIGSPLTDTLENVFVARLNFTDLSTIYARFIGGNRRDVVSKAVMHEGVLHITGNTGSTDFPVTNGSGSSIQFNDLNDGYYTRIGPGGAILFSTYLTTPDLDNPSRLIVNNGDAYVCGTSVSTINGQKSALAHRIDNSGTIVYSRRLKIGGNTNNINPTFELAGDELLIAGVSQAPDFPVTTLQPFFVGGTGFVTKLDALGNQVYSSFLGSMTTTVQLKSFSGLTYILGNSSTANFPVTNGSTISGASDHLLIVLNNTTGTPLFASYYGGNSTELASVFDIYNNEVFFGGKTSSPNYPVTSNSLYRAAGDQFITKISFCPVRYKIDSDTLSPREQTTCRLGLGEKISGTDIRVPGDSLPQLFLNGIATLQPPIVATYQWQQADAVSGPWADIPHATFRDFTPQAGAGDRYFRRISFSSPFCSTSFIHYSDTAALLVNNLTAPTLQTTGPFITCPGVPVTIGGSPTASGGNPPYVSYEWDNGASPVSNPTVVIGSSALYTLIVTDNLGCKQIGQSAVLTFKAKAGPDRGACGGNAVQIGSPALAGISGTQYSWQPATGLNSTSVAQPLANPNAVTDYIFTLSIPITNGGTCETTDTIKVTPVAAPINTNFAGSDKVFCLESNVTLGAPPEPGFNYVWSPGSYLTSNTFSTTTYYAGNTVMPVPNPAVINVTAQKNGCAFTDQTIVATIEARAGLDGCGPRLIGLPDRTPDINETYSWVKLSGSGDFTGPTNLPQVPVSASIGTPTVYGLTVTYNGGSCYDEITVVPFCSSCQTIIEVQASYSCPSYDVNGGNVSLIAYTSIDNAVFSWSPQVGLSSYTGSVVQLTDNVPRIYTVTARDINDSNIVCSDNIFVNDPAFSKPVFPASDTVTCSNQPVTIGAPPVSGYTYQWTGNGLSSNLSSNPVATVAQQTAFPVLVTDASGCELRDTVIVAVQNVQVNGGPDWILCSSGNIRMGSLAQPNTSYLWEPASSPWQNGTNQFSAQPEVFVATDLDFVVTATTTAGCSTSDTVRVSINNNPVLPDAADKFTCIGTAVQIGNPAIPGVTYQWSPSTGLSNPTLAQPMANPASTTTYTLIATFPGSCSGNATDQVTVTVGTAFFSMPDISFCPDNGPVALGVNAPANMVAYNWLPVNQVTNASIANPFTINPPPKNIATYTLQVTNQDGCRYRDTIQLIPVITAPVAGNDRLICKDQTTTLGSVSNTTGPGISYSWSPASQLDDPSSPTPLFTGSSGGTFTYILTKTDSNVSCSSRDTVVVTVADVSFNLINNPVVCDNSCIQIGTTAQPGIQYQWAPIAGLSNPQIANPLACVNTNSFYTLTATALNGCSYTADVVIVVSTLSSAQINIPDVTVCVGDTNVVFTPSINPPGNYTYQWSPNDGTLSNINIQNPEITVTGPGVKTYTLQVTDTVTGCSNSANATVSASICSPLSIVGDFMWYDTNSNGIQDSGENGVSGMVVQLYNIAGALVGSTITDPAGYYFFPNVIPGTGYYILFSKPTGYDYTQQNTGGINASNNSKADINGRSINFDVPAGTSVLNMDAGIRATCTVPVTLVSFTGNRRNEAIWLYWETSAEINNDYFIVERSNDAVHFSAIGMVDGHGTSSLTHHYSLKDEGPLKGVNYYRLKQVDVDGNYSYSEVIAISMPGAASTVAIQYHQGEHSIRVLYSEEQKNVLYRLFSNNGQLVYQMIQKTSSNNYTLKLPVLSSGMYVLQVLNDKIKHGERILISR